MGKRKFEQRRDRQQNFDVFAALQRLRDERDVKCWACDSDAKNHDPCCSSHHRALCCEHYRKFHFVEVG